MKFNELTVSSRRSAKRVGRGISSGKGKTAGRGTKGQKARTGSTKRPGFAGGQNPLMQQLPKLPGFRSYRAKAELVYTDQLNTITVKTVSNESLAKDGMISSEFVAVKLLYRGDVKKGLTVKLQNASEKAISSLQNAGGSFEKTAVAQRPKTTKKEEK